MKYIFNIGFNKSGTTSLYSALNYLRLPTLHYWYNNEPIEKVIKKNIKFKRNLFHSLDDRYVGFSDFNGVQYYKDLFYQYPNSKFIFTTRDIDDWIKSLINHRLNMNEIKPYQIEKQVDKLSKKYINKTAEIRNFFESNKSQFLEMRICDGDGWETLCSFLGLEIPNVPFPYENKTVYK